MSLLLDALKKAADDKQKAAQSGASDAVEKHAETSDEERSENNQPDMENELKVSGSQGAAQVDELTLEIDETNLEPPVEEELSLEEEVVYQPQPVASNETAASPQDSSPVKQGTADKEAPFTISDEALSLLIYKTNSEVKRGRRILYTGMMLISLCVISAGGVIYYMDMQDEIASIERKHQLAMRAMQSKTNSENAPVKSAIVNNLVSEGALADKVEFAKSQITKSKVDNNKQTLRDTKLASTELAKGLNIQKTKKTDPVGDVLNDAWLAYEASQYDQAKRSYRSVLSIEKNNRDALLGLGAIAIVENDTVTAREVYSDLLKLDPRDPIATAAMASLQQNAGAQEEEQAYLRDMVKKSPEAAELNFALGNSYASQSKWKLAQQSYFAAWQADSDNANYIFNLAVSMDQLKKSGQALGLYQQSLAKAGDKQVSFSRQAVKQRIRELSEL